MHFRFTQLNERVALKWLLLWVIRSLLRRFCFEGWSCSRRSHYKPYTKRKVFLWLPTGFLSNRFVTFLFKWKNDTATSEKDSASLITATVYLKESSVFLVSIIFHIRSARLGPTFLATLHQFSCLLLEWDTQWAVLLPHPQTPPPPSRWGLVLNCLCMCEIFSVKSLRQV